MGKAFKLRNGMLLVSTEAPGGIYNSSQLAVIAALAESDAAIVKVTEDQRLALLVKPAKLSDVASELRAAGLGLRHYQDGLHQPAACVGKFCPEFQQDALATAMDLSNALAAVELGTALRLGINGCSRCCVPTHTLDISMVGEANGYRVSLGGKNSQIPEMATFMAEGIPAEELPKLITKVVEVYKDVAQKDETLQETMERFGSSAFIAALAPYSQDAAGSDGNAHTPHGDDPFQRFDASAVPGSSGPTVEDHGDELAFEQEPSVEAFGEESLTDSSAGLIAVEDIEESTIDANAVKLIDLPKPAEYKSSTPGVEHSDTAKQSATGPKPIAVAPVQEPLRAEDLALSVLAAEVLANQSIASEDQEDLDDSLVDLEEEIFEDAVETPLPARGLSSGSARQKPVMESPAQPPRAFAQPTEQPTFGGKKPETLHDTPQASFEDDYGEIDELDGEAADQFESKLNDSIAEEEQVPVFDDLNSQSRLEAMRLVEAPSPIHEDLHVEGGFNNLGIEEEESDSLPDEEAVAEAPEPTEDPGFELVAMEFTAEGRLLIQFSTGAAITLDPRTFKVGSRRELSIAGKQVLIMAQERGFSVEVDGIGVFAPAPKARAPQDASRGGGRPSKNEPARRRSQAAEARTSVPRRRNA